MKTFRINDTQRIECEQKKTRNGFKHEAFYYKNGELLYKVKVCYLNRTWESFDFETVISRLLRIYNIMPEDQQKVFLECCGKQEMEEFNQRFGMIGAIASMGNLLCDTKKEKNDWKARMLKAGIGGLDIPADWDTLSEEERETRLNRVIEFVQQPLK